MNEVTRKRLERVAERISDEQPVDWNVEADETEQGRRRLANLRVLEQIRVIHCGEGAEAVPAQEATRPLDPARPGRSPAAASHWGPLELRAPIGSGSAGSVFRAWDPDLQTEVALKLHNHPGDASTDFLQEARQLAKVRHPNVVVVHGARERSGRLGIWMELIRGHTLEECLQQQGPYGANEATSIGIDVLRALAAVHGAGLVHRDVKASNVMREDGGRVVLMDFSSTVERPRLQDLSDGEAFVGTARYMSPEIFAGQAGGRTSDLYAVGVLLYRLATAEYPIDARSARELRDRHLRGEYVPLRDRRPDLPAGFVRVVEKALAPDPTDRYQTAGEMERELASTVAAGSSRRGNWWIPALGVAAAAGLVVGLTALYEMITTPLEVEAAFFRATRSEEVRLQPNAQLQAGDQLFLEVRGSRRMWAYVFDEDDQGEAWVLFPLDGCDIANPLPADRKMRLPGTFGGELNNWRVTSAGGREHLFVVVSARPLEKLEKMLERMPSAGSAGIPVRIPLETIRGLRGTRGVGGVSPPAAGPAGAAGPLAATFRELAAEEESRGLWTWSITLENPDE